MATHSPAARGTRIETREVLRVLRERNAQSRERVLQHAANLGRIAEKLRATRRA
jgi:hypothetical protein